MTPFWDRWNSWAVELPVGAGGQILLHVWGPAHPLWLYWLVGLAASAIYELILDRHGWSWRDVGQRLVGQVKGELLVQLWRVV